MSPNEEALWKEVNDLKERLAHALQFWQRSLDHTDRAINQTSRSISQTEKVIAIIRARDKEVLSMLRAKP